MISEMVTLKKATVRGRLFTVIGVLVLGVMTIAVIALLALSTLNTGFDDFSEHRLPELEATTAIAQKAQGVITGLSRLSNAQSNAERQDLYDTVTTDMDDILRILHQLSIAKDGRSTVAALFPLFDKLKTELQTLNSVVRQRIEADGDSDRVFRMLPGLSRRLGNIQRTLVDQLKEKAQQSKRHSSLITPYIEVVIQWAHKGNRALAIAGGISGANLTGFVSQQEEIFLRLDQEMTGLALILPPDAAPYVARISVAFDDLHGEQNSIFSARRRQIVLDDLSKVALSNAFEVGTDFSRLINEAYVQAVADANKENAFFRDFVDQNMLYMIMVVIVVSGVSIFGAYFIHVRVTQRLSKLATTMTVRAKGGYMPIDVEGLDEITEMAKALSYFVDELEAREFRSREAKDAAEKALHDLKSAQQELIEAEKMASLGGLVAGIAHEINTPIGVCVTCSSHLKDITKDVNAMFASGKVSKSRLQDLLGRIDEAADILGVNLERAAKLVASFKRVSVDRSNSTVRNINLSAYIDDILTSIHPELSRTKIQVTKDIAEDIWLETDPGEFAQVVINLVMNAVIHAYAQGAEGKIVLRGLDDGETVHLVVADDGKGMSEETSAKVFEPFFTTKRDSGGTGLGLHIVYNIITRALEGRISLSSKEGEGTAFTIELPKKISKQVSA